MKDNIVPDTLYYRLNEYSKTDYYPFHMPGHKRRLMSDYLDNAYRLDITEIDGFDNLHDPSGIIADAQRRAAELFHSEQTYFLVNGSSSGILAAICSTCSPGSEVIIARDCHKSVYHAIETAGLMPFFIYSEINDELDISNGIYPQNVEELWIKHENIQAIVITSPTYQGIVSDIKKICRIAHTHNVPVIVDEAHGAHLSFSDYFPESAVQCGADIVIQSTHKTLPVLTQTALLHVNGDIVDRDRLRHMLSIFQSSSPSYLLMGSIDEGLSLIKNNGSCLYKSYTDEIKFFRNKCRNFKNIRLFDIDNTEHIFDYDRSKIVIFSKDRCISGKKIYDILRKKYHIQLEMAAVDHALAMTSICDDHEGFSRLYEALSEMDENISGIMCKKVTKMNRIPEAETYMIPQKAVWTDKEYKKLSECLGRISSEYIYLYPPDIPVIIPGEIFSDEVIECIRMWKDLGFYITGTVSDNNDNILVGVI